MSGPAEAVQEKHLLFTGFPGFIGRRLIQALAVQEPAYYFHLLTLPHFTAKAEEEIHVLDGRVPGLAQRVQIHPGDITSPRLGLATPDYERLASKCRYVYHLAAIYDLAVAKQPAYRINLDGTSHVLDFCAAAKVDRLVYFSTCYVSGKRGGTVYEHELFVGQQFKNYYEETKCKAEIEVRKRMDHIPTVIIRPAIVIGDSRTGETNKYDGPYYIISLLADFQRRGWLVNGMPFPLLGPGAATVNLIPIDYLIDVTAALDKHPEAIGMTFQVADPQPLRVSAVLKEIARRFDMNVIGQVPMFTVELALSLPGIAEFVGIPKQSLAYFDHHVNYDTTNVTRILGGTPVCPQLETYLDVIVDFVRKHPRPPA